MRIVRRIHVFLIIVSLLGGASLSGARADAPDRKHDAIFRKAIQLETDQPDKALNEYNSVKGDRSQSREIQAEALLRGALLGYNGLLRAPDQSMSPDARAQRQEVLLDVARKSHDAVKSLMQDFADTEAGRAAATQRYGKDGRLDLKLALETEIDARNSHSFNYQLVNSLVRATGSVPAFSYWFALILIAVIVKGLTFPLTLRMYKSQREMQRIQPHMKALQEKYKNDKVAQQQKMMELYKEHGVNPMASCFPMLIQLPFMIWVYNTIRLYEYHFAKGTFLWIGPSLGHRFPGLIAANLAQFDVLLLVLYAGSNYLTMKLTPATDPTQAAQQKQMSIMMTVMMFYMFWMYKWSGAFILYWLALNAISAVQQYVYIYKPNRHGAAGGVSVLPAEPRQLKSAANGAAERSAPVPERPTTPVPNSTMRPRPRRKNKNR